MSQWAYCCIKHTGKGLYISFMDPYSGITYQRLHQDPTRQDETYYDTLMNAIVQLGADQWELVNVLPVDNLYENWYFKKSLP